MKRERVTVIKGISYIIGMIILAVGLALTALTELGTSPLTSVAYVMASWMGISFADMTLVMFCIFALAQIPLLKERTYKTVAKILLQIPLSIFFTRIMAIVKLLINLSECSIDLRCICLIFSIILTGIGAAITLNANLIPNPGDGIVRAIAVFWEKPLGTVKNYFDTCNVVLAAVLSLILMQSLNGFGIGSIIAMLGVGRVIAVYNKLLSE